MKINFICLLVSSIIENPVSFKLVKRPEFRSLKKRCNSTRVSSIPGHGIGDRKKPSSAISEANMKVSVWFKKHFNVAIDGSNLFPQ